MKRLPPHKILTPARFFGYFIVFMLIFICGAAPHSSGEDSGPSSVAIIVSLKIRPYFDALDGLKKAPFKQAGFKLTIFFLDDYKGKSREILLKNLETGNFAQFIAIGPEAMRFIWNEVSGREDLKAFTMVLHPENIIERNTDFLCGIPLDIPFQKEIEIISEVAPAIKRIGLLYGQKSNGEFVLKAQKIAADYGITIIPLKAETRSDIPIILNSNWDKIDSLFLIPDRVIISESLVKYIIKESILNKVAAIGYNRFFYESGAAIAFVLNYHDIGENTGRLVLDRLSHGLCKKTVPVFKAWINMRVARTLNMKITEKSVNGAEEGP